MGAPRKKFLGSLSQQQQWMGVGCKLGTSRLFSVCCVFWRELCSGKARLPKGAVWPRGGVTSWRPWGKASGETVPGDPGIELEKNHTFLGVSIGRQKLHLDLPVIVSEKDWIWGLVCCSCFFPPLEAEAGGSLLPGHWTIWKTHLQKPSQASPFGSNKKLFCCVVPGLLQESLQVPRFYESRDGLHRGSRFCRIGRGEAAWRDSLALLDFQKPKAEYDVCHEVCCPRKTGISTLSRSFWFCERVLLRNTGWPSP